ncbi:flavin reductase [Bradyrhizobium liaoningense]|uniref:flavin reductase n=1 Tax=Bradyrhizobium liaoningense TaxID=43992 RepID=UPI001BA6D5B0|nr:flavin reductase [Bradyrhizobium liaoningense]MBR0713911.1 flavin reductase [Bradyrhizobium liaoningense]
MSYQFDHRELRDVLGSFVTGVTVVTTVDEERRHHGLTVNSFSSVSLDPPLVLWSQSNSSPSYPIFSKSGRFVINILAEDQIDLSNRFARSGPDKFSNLEIDIGNHGLPILKDTSAWLVCRFVSAIPGGDHTIFLGEVEQIRRTARRPLVFGGGKYLVADTHDLAPPQSGKTPGDGPFHAMRLGGRVIARLAAEFDQSFALAVWGSHGPTVINWAPSLTSPRKTLPVGLVLPVTLTAPGIAFAAHLPKSVTEPFVEAELSPSAIERWSADLQTARAHGLAMTINRLGGGDSALSVPVRDANGHAVLTITAVGDTGQFEPRLDSPLAEALRVAGRSLSRRLGYVGENGHVHGTPQAADP